MSKVSVGEIVNVAKELEKAQSYLEVIEDQIIFAKRFLYELETWTNIGDVNLNFILEALGGAGYQFKHAPKLTRKSNVAELATYLLLMDEKAVGA